MTTACRVLDVSRAGFYDWSKRPLSPRAVNDVWLTDLITEIHAGSRGTYGSSRVHAELRQGRENGEHPSLVCGVIFTLVAMKGRVATA